MFGWLFGKNKKQLKHEEHPGDSSDMGGIQQQAQGTGPADPAGESPEGRRAWKFLSNAPPVMDLVKLQQEYWAWKPAEWADLQARGWERLSWPQRLRLHHLNCLALLEQEPFRSQLSKEGVPTETEPATPPDHVRRCRESAERLLAEDSPYGLRCAVIWTGQSAPNDRSPPDLVGMLCNPSLTHLGCLEVVRVDDNNPPEIGFIAFADIHKLALWEPMVFRAVKITYEGGRPGEYAFVPLMYGLTGRSPSEDILTGRKTRFVAFLGGDGPASAYGIGLGQQNLMIRPDVVGPAAPEYGVGFGQQNFMIRQKQGQTLFGFYSLAAANFGLGLSDPCFESKCRARGLDPAEVRRSLRENR
jgi:hypothetical protein